MPVATLSILLVLLYEGLLTITMTGEHVTVEGVLAHLAHLLQVRWMFAGDDPAADARDPSAYGLRMTMKSECLRGGLGSGRFLVLGMTLKSQGVRVK